MASYHYSNRIPQSFDRLDNALCYYQAELLPVLLLELHICKRALDPALNFSNAQIAQLFVSGGHQQRIPKKDVSAALERFPHLWTAVYTSFEALYDDVKRCLYQIHRCGELTCYDVAKRIGYIRGLLPEKVFICSTTVQTAAENFLGRTLSFGCQLPVSEFAGLEPLTALEIENFLCIFSEYLVCGGIRMPAPHDFDDVRYSTFYDDALLGTLKLK